MKNKQEAEKFEYLIPDEIIERILVVLNRANDSDSKAMNDLITTRVGCNIKLADDPTIQVAAPTDGDIGLSPSDSYQVGLLGVINGFCGKKNGWGPIAAIFEKDGSLSGFKRTPNTI